jgi:hypothetical protein
LIRRDVRFLAELRKCEELRAKILGLFKKDEDEEQEKNPRRPDMLCWRGV